MLDLRLMKDLAVITAAGVGGGSLVYANVQLRAPAAVFEEPPWPAAITAAELEPVLRPQPGGAPADARPRRRPRLLPKVRAFDAMAERAGRTATRLPLAVHFGESRRHPFSGVFQQGCQNLGRCDLGCPGAGQEHGRHHLPRARRGARRRGLSAARSASASIRRGRRRAAGGSASATSQYRISGAVEAPLLVLAAGTIGTSRLLLKNRGRLSRLSPALGSRFSGNGDALALALDPAAPGVSGARTEYGPSMTSRIDYTDERRLHGRRRRTARELRRVARDRP